MNRESRLTTILVKFNVGKSGLPFRFRASIVLFCNYSSMPCVNSSVDNWLSILVIARSITFLGFMSMAEDGSLIDPLVQDVLSRGYNPLRYNGVTVNDIERGFVYL